MGLGRVAGRRYSRSRASPLICTLGVVAPALGVSTQPSQLKAIQTDGFDVGNFCHWRKLLFGKRGVNAVRWAFGK